MCCYKIEIITTKVWLSSWTRGSLLCVMKTDLYNVSSFSFPLLSTLDLTFMSKSVGVSRKAEDAKLPVFPRVRVAHLLLLICMYDLCSLLCMSVFDVWSLSLDCILFITTITLVPLITLSNDNHHTDSPGPIVHLLESGLFM